MGATVSVYLESFSFKNGGIYKFFVIWNISVHLHKKTTVWSKEQIFKKSDNERIVNYSSACNT